MRGIRNRMAHGYFELNMDIIWDTVTMYLDDLGQKVANIKGTVGQDDDLRLVTYIAKQPFLNLCQLHCTIT